MKFAISLFAACTLLVQAQTLNVTTSPAVVNPGGTVKIAIGFTDASPSSNIAGFEFTLLAGSLNAQLGAPTLDAASTAAGKQVTCATPSTSAGLTCVIVSSANPLNDTPIASGGLVIVPLVVPANAAAGQIQTPVGNISAADINGNAIPVTLAIGPTPTMFTIRSKYDINSDGTVDSGDVQAAVQALLTNTCTGAFALIGDKKCGLTDVMLELLAALGSIPQ